MPVRPTLFRLLFPDIVSAISTLLIIPFGILAYAFLVVPGMDLTLGIGAWAFCLLWIGSAFRHVQTAYQFVANGEFVQGVVLPHKSPRLPVWLRPKGYTGIWVPYSYVYRGKKYTGKFNTRMTINKLGKYVPMHNYLTDGPIQLLVNPDNPEQVLVLDEYQL